MRKLIPILFILFAITITACGNDVLHEDFKDEAVKEMLSGVLEKQSSGSDQKGTHILTSKSDITTPLRSVSINLDNDEYLGNEVDVTGFRNESDGVFEVTKIELVKELEEEEEEQDGELTDFKSSFLGFQLEYYSDWTVDSLDDQAIFTSKNENQVIISQIPFSYQPKNGNEPDDKILLPLESYVSQFYPEVDNFKEVSRIIGEDDLSAIMLDDGNNRVDYLVYRNGLIYKMTFYPINSEFVDDEIRQFSDMVNSFKFIGFADEIDMPVDNDFTPSEDRGGTTSLPEVDEEFTYFESLPYHFKAVYPSSWYYSGSRSSKDGIYHHYSFSDEAIEDDNELISFDIISNNLPSGDTINVNDLTIVESKQGGKTSYGVELNGQRYVISGDSQYSDIMLHMAASLEVVELEEEED